MNAIAKTQSEWREARKAFLEKEKAFAKAGDDLAAERRALPKIRLEKSYVFESLDGPVSLSDLFDGRSQLIVQHFMFGPDWEEGCPSCSFWADGFSPMIVHMNQRDISFVAISRAPVDKIAKYKKRMGWTFNWVSSISNEFNFDFHVSATEDDIASEKIDYNYREGPLFSQELPGVSVFEKEADGSIFHTYATYARGLDRMNAAYAYIDLTPKGRNEADLPHPMAWVRRHDQYS